ncbi:MAG TPA: T9SS type A sorting domain-containing protein [Roseivirga sp.]
MKKTGGIIALLLLSVLLHGQIIERPLPNTFEQLSSVPYSSHQTQNALILPFWDDFSTSLRIPSSDKWQSSNQIRISNGIGIQAPTLHVAILDGVDASGAPYDANNFINGATDSLVSLPIDLTLLSVDQQDSVFLSFFWQVSGNGELPDREDSLVLQFKSAAGQWERVWSTQGGRDLETGEFFQEILQVQPRFFHDDFQFKFQSYSRLAGAFDTWLLDYIYMNDSRHPGDTAYLDRALTRKPSFLTTPYTAMPTEQFFANPSRYLRPTDAEFVNLNSIFQPVQYSTIVRDLVEDQQIEVLNDDRVANPLPGAFERRTFTSPALNPANLNALADSLWLETTYYIRSGDNFYIEDINPGVDTTFNTNIDYRINDTVRVVTVIDDYLAYDDGEPDFAAGINQRGGQLAYQFYVEQRALLTHVDINFPFVQQTGEPIEIYIWRDLDNQPESILYQASYSVLRPENIGDLRSYLIDEPIFVEDTFYIGFEQATNEFLAVGLDKNQDTGNKMFYNVSGQWRANEFVNGSFLMRPRFDKEIAANFNPNPSGEAADIKLYPNPTEGILFLEGDLDGLMVFDNWGQEASYKINQVTNGHTIDLSFNKKGIYLLRLTQGGKVRFKRIILKE